MKRAGHSNRAGLAVDPNGKWRLYTGVLPAGTIALGTVTHGDGETGALARVEATGAYVQVNAGIARALDGRKVAAALGTTGRPAEMEGGKRVNVYLDAESLERAAKLGSGNVSEGIRRALREK